MAEEGAKRGQAVARRRAVFMIPNLFTALALLAGFYAVAKAIEGEHAVAGWAIFAAAVMDMLDGRVARLIDAQSDFGAQFDSLSDVICFGLAPAVLAHQWGLAELGRFGFAVGFFFTAAAAVRLARFNVTHGGKDPRFFAGLPSPMAGVTVASAVLVAGDEPALGTVVVVTLLMCFIAATMVSEFRYYAFKDVDLRARVNSPQKLLLALGLISFVALVMLEFRAAGVLLVCLLYLASGFALSWRHYWRRARDDHWPKVRKYWDGVKKRIEERRKDGGKG